MFAVFLNRLKFSDDCVCGEVLPFFWLATYHRQSDVFYTIKLKENLTSSWSVKLHAGETSLVRLQRGLKSEILFFYPIKKLNKIRLLGDVDTGALVTKHYPVLIEVRVEIKEYFDAKMTAFVMSNFDMDAAQVGD